MAALTNDDMADPWGLREHATEVGGWNLVYFEANEYPLGCECCCELNCGCLCEEEHVE